MKNKKLSLVLILVIVFQLVLIITPPIYESIAFSRCEKYGKEYKIRIPSLQIDIFDSENEENYMYINIRNYYDDLSVVKDEIGFMLNEKGFCVYDLYGNNKDKYVDSVKKEFLYGRGYVESEVMLSDGVTFEGLAEYLNKKTGNIYHDEYYYNEYFYFDFLESYGIEAYITVKVYGGVMIKEALYIDGEKVLEFNN